MGEGPDSWLARFHVRPVHSTDGQQDSCERSDSDSDQADPASPARPRPGVPLEGSGYFGRSRRMPACDVQRSPHGVGSPPMVARPRSSPGVLEQRPVHNSSDLCVRDALEVTEHQHGTLELRQLVVGGDDSTKLFGHPFHTVSDSRI